MRLRTLSLLEVLGDHVSEIVERPIVTDMLSDAVAELDR